MRRGRVPNSRRGFNPRREDRGPSPRWGPLVFLGILVGWLASPGAVFWLPGGCASGSPPVVVLAEVGQEAVYRTTSGAGISYGSYRITNHTENATQVHMTWDAYLANATGVFNATPTFNTSMTFTGDLVADIFREFPQPSNDTQGGTSTGSSTPGNETQADPSWPGNFSFSDAEFLPVFGPIVIPNDTRFTLIQDDFTDALVALLGGDLEVTASVECYGYCLHLVFYYRAIFLFRVAELTYYYATTGLLLRTDLLVRNPLTREEFTTRTTLLPVNTTLPGASQDPTNPAGIQAPPPASTSSTGTDTGMETTTDTPPGSTTTGGSTQDNADSRAVAWYNFLVGSAIAGTVVVGVGISWTIWRKKRGKRPLPLSRPSRGNDKRNGSNYPVEEQGPRESGGPSI